MKAFSSVIRKHFVYGTLRPDIKAIYSDEVHYGEFDITYSKAKLPGAKLFHFVEEEYPTVLFTDNQSDIVHGYILECESPEFTDLLDRIEEYPSLYRKVEKEVFVYETMKKEKALVYYEVDFCKKYTNTNLNKLNTELYSFVESGDYSKIYKKNYG